MILKLRISGETSQAIRDFTRSLEDLPGVTETDGVSIHPNYRSSGFRGYITLVMKKEESFPGRSPGPP